MDIPESTYTIEALTLTGILLGAMLVVRLMSPLERQLLSGVAVFLAGLFFIGRAVEPVAVVVGSGLWLGGIGAFVHAGLQWHSAAMTRVLPLGILLVLPPAFFGAVLVGGLVISLIVV